ncbi:MAG: SpoIIE family protein phosphatase, partial [Bacteroidales bacterium]|nr:SpoIIE family protein phosphatase [Bacteroidales bacterium]
YYPNVTFPKFENTRIYAMIEDFRHNIWIATQSGLHKFNINTYEISSFYKNDGLCDNLVVSLFEDDMNQIWIGTANGLNVYDFSKPNEFKVFQASDSLKNDSLTREFNTLSNNYIYSIKQGKKYFWIGTGSGLNRYDRARKKFKYFLKKDGLPNETIYEIQIDKNDNLWISTNRGIVKFNTQKNKFVAYDKGDGLQGLEFDNGASFKSHDGEFFFGGVNGLNSFYPDSIYNNDFEPEIVFNYYKVISTKTDKQKKIPIQEKDTIILKYTDKSLTIFFSALEFTNPQKNQYKYFLEGQNKKWQLNSNKNFAIFTNLDQGTYTFKVKGSNNDYMWSTEKEIIIIVYPPFYKTFWAYFIYVIVFGSILFFFFRTRTNKLRMDNQLLRSQQTASMEIAKQREELQIKNKNIMDSINYAKRIQRGMMPTEFLLKHFFPQSFLFYRPRDVVSGDFYWFTEKNNKFFIAAVDCTGHGVPGAFMSIIGINLLNNIIIEKDIENPGEILNLMNQGLYENLNKEVDDITLRDGMDMSVCVIHNNSHKIEYAGAMNSIFLIRNDRLIEVAANRFSIGSVEPDERGYYETHTFDSQLDDMLYLFSDGFIDQFGGPNGKKYKIRRFRKLIMDIQKKSTEEQEKILDQEVTNWKGTLEQVDDITIIGLRF